MTKNINNDGIPDEVYFIVEFDRENLDVIEKHISYKYLKERIIGDIKHEKYKKNNELWKSRSFK